MARTRRAPQKRAPAKKPAARTTYVDAVADDSAANLKKIEHIVVLMLENRSFDHMLGYLSLEGGREDVDGLKAGMANRYKGRSYKIRHLQRTALTKDEDPCHGGACTAEQVSNNMGGFVSNFARKRPKAKLVDVVMAHFNAEDLPVYDHLAREFCVCDRWFSSVPGATWPNRLYSLAGRADGDREDADPPLYNVPTVFRFLDQHRVDWRFYSFDPATLRLVDGEYRLSHHHNFA